MSRSNLARYKIINKEDLEGALKCLTAAGPLEHIKFRGYSMQVETDRYENLYYHGCKCAKCGAEAKYGAIEKIYGVRDRFHLNVYVEKDGKDYCLTKDHIYPRALGGFDILENYQVLCERCNGNKGNKTTMTLDEAVERGLTSYEAAAAAQTVIEERKKLIELESATAKQRRKLKEAQEIFEQYIPKRDKSEFI